MLKHTLTSRLTWVPSHRAPLFLLTSNSRKVKVWETTSNRNNTLVEVLTSLLSPSNPFLCPMHAFNNHPSALKLLVAHKLFPNSLARCLSPPPPPSFLSVYFQITFLLFPLLLLNNTTCYNRKRAFASWPHANIRYFFFLKCPPFFPYLNFTHSLHLEEMLYLSVRISSPCPEISHNFGGAFHFTFITYFFDYFYSWACVIIFALIHLQPLEACGHLTSFCIPCASHIIDLPEIFGRPTSLLKKWIMHLRKQLEKYVYYPRFWKQSFRSPHS